MKSYLTDGTFLLPSRMRDEEEERTFISSRHRGLKEAAVGLAMACFILFSPILST